MFNLKKLPTGPALLVQERSKQGEICRLIDHYWPKYFSQLFKAKGRQYWHASSRNLEICCRHLVASCYVTALFQRYQAVVVKDSLIPPTPILDAHLSQKEHIVFGDHWYAYNFPQIVSVQQTGPHYAPARGYSPPDVVKLMQDAVKEVTEDDVFGSQLQSLFLATEAFDDV